MTIEAPVQTNSLDSFSLLFTNHHLHNIFVPWQLQFYKERMEIGHAVQQESLLPPPSKERGRHPSRTSEPFTIYVNGRGGRRGYIPPRLKT